MAKDYYFKNTRGNSACVLPQENCTTETAETWNGKEENSSHEINWLCKTWLWKKKANSKPRRRMEAKRIINEVKNNLLSSSRAKAVDFFFYHQSFQRRNAQPVLFYDSLSSFVLFFFLFSVNSYRQMPRISSLARFYRVGN
jgi:hypothetical protein